MKTAPTPFSLDRTSFSVGRLQDESKSLDYWLSLPPARRLEALEHLRRSFNPEAYSARGIRRIFEAAKRA
jgi:hypothetical protein